MVACLPNLFRYECIDRRGEYLSRYFPSFLLFSFFQPTTAIFAVANLETRGVFLFPVSSPSSRQCFTQFVNTLVLLILAIA